MLAMNEPLKLTEDNRHAIKFYKKLRVIYRDTSQRALEGAALFQLARLYKNEYDYNEAIELCTKAIRIAIETKEKRLEHECYVKLGSIFQSLGVYVKSVEYHKQALAIAEEIGDKEREVACYERLVGGFLSLGEKTKGKEYQEKALATAEKIGDKEAKAKCYQNLGNSIRSVGEHIKAMECYEKALAIAEEISDEGTKAECYKNLGIVFESLGKHVKAKEYHEKGLAADNTEAHYYGNLGSSFQSISEYVKAIEYQEKALAIAEKIGDRRIKAACYGNIGRVLECRGEHVRATEYYQKALAIAEKIGDKDMEAAFCENLGMTFRNVGECAKAKDCLERAAVICGEAGKVEKEITLHLLISLCMIEAGNIPKAEIHFLDCLSAVELLRSFLKDHGHFKIAFLDRFGRYFRNISHLICLAGHPNLGLYTEEIGRGRALADLMTAQYPSKKEIITNPEQWVGIERIVKREHNCAFLYISYLEKFFKLWVIKAHKQLFFRKMNVNDCFAGNGPESKVADVFGTEVFRETFCLAPEQCEDRSWFPSNVDSEQTRKSSQGNSLTGCRLVEEDEDDQQPIPTLADGYKMIITPVTDLLDKTELIIVPDRLFFKVPFAALKDEREKYLSESFRIRIVPSLRTLKLIQDCPADYHSQTGALIVGDPKVGEVLYKGNLQQVSRLPFASEEAEMVGGLLGTKPLLGKQATKETVLQSIHSVSLIHFAAHGDADRGEIVLAPPPGIDRKPQEEDYLLTMANISQVRLRAKLVVLSCCHTAQGQIKTEGVVGIARAFLGSGARSVLVALWAIQDEATKQFMSRFYEHLVRGESASESLHQAMKWMRENGFSKVQQWAPFLLVGDNVTLDFQKLRLVETY